MNFQIIAKPAALFCTLLLAVVHDMVHKTYQT